MTTQLPPEGRPEGRADRFFGNNWLFIVAVIVLTVINLYLLATSNQGDALVAINRWRSPFLDYFFKVGTHFAEPVAYIGVVVLVSAFSYRRAVFTVVSGALAGIVAGLLKAGFGQPRPHRWFFDNFEEIWHSLNHFEEEWRTWDELSSFPSGHTASAFALYGFLAFNARQRKVSVTLLCLCLAVMVGFSRMYLFYHFLRDVTAGAIVGTMVAMMAYYLQPIVLPHLGGNRRGWARRRRTLPPVSKKVPPPPA